MYLGARKFTGINTMLNIISYLTLFFILEFPINFYTVSFFSFIFVFYYIFNIYSLEIGKITTGDFFNSFIINIVFVILSLSLFKLDKSLEFFIIAFILQNLYKGLICYLFIKNRNIMIVGNGKKTNQLKQILEKKQMYKVVLECSVEDLVQKDIMLYKYNISKIIITEKIEDRNVIDLIMQFKFKGVQVFDYLGFVEKVEEKVPVDSIDEEWILYGTGFSILHNGIQNKIKRVFDLLCAILIGLITIPIMFISALIVRIESKGPILFSQIRIGLGNKPFKIYKFRSMKMHEEAEYSDYAQKKDDRITKYGKFMRKSRIDELPQLWNVIKGDMSFVGPRAEWDKLCYGYMDKIPFYNIRHSIKPGLTGWAQVKYPYGASVEDAYQKLQYDLYYIKNQNFAFDIMVFFKTAKIVIFGRGR